MKKTKIYFELFLLFFSLTNTMLLSYNLSSKVINYKNYSQCVPQVPCRPLVQPFRACRGFQQHHLTLVDLAGQACHEDPRTKIIQIIRYAVIIGIWNNFFVGIVMTWKPSAQWCFDINLKVIFKHHCADGKIKIIIEKWKSTDETFEKFWLILDWHIYQCRTKVTSIVFYLHSSK